MTPSAERRSRYWLVGLLAFALLLAGATIAFLHAHPPNHASAQLP